MLGTLCPFEHGEGMAAPAVPEYDPNHASLAMQPYLNGRQPNDNGTTGTSFGAQRRQPTRAPFSQPGSSYNNLDDTVVVEQIPEDHFSEQHVRDFFSQFGTIVDVKMHAYKRLAIVKFSAHPGAQRAYDNPKVIFDNRFVKVYWYKPENQSKINGIKGNAAHVPAGSAIPEIYNGDEEMVDVDEFSKQQARLQKEFEEKRKKAEEATARANMLNAQLRATEEGLNRLRSHVIAKTRAKGVEAINRKEQLAASQGSSRTGGLSELQAEAAGLFAHAEANPAPKNNHGAFAFLGGDVSGSVIRLDNRPRRLAVAGIIPGSDRETALKRYLLVSHRR